MSGEIHHDYLRPGGRVKWLSKYNEKTWFAGTILSVIGDRAVVRAKPDDKVLVLPTYRLHAIIV